MYVLTGSTEILHMHGQLDKHSCIGRVHLTCHNMLGCILKQQACVEDHNSAAACRVPGVW